MTILVLHFCTQQTVTLNGCQTFRPYVTLASRRFGPFRPSDVSALDVSHDVWALIRP